MSCPTVLTNSSARKNFIKNEFLRSPVSEQQILIAAAFFTDAETIDFFTHNNNTVNIVVRLGFPTNAHALRKILNNEKVNIRFYTSSRFHPKLYIFEEFALVGSANLTQSALMVNQEVVIKIYEESLEYEELRSVFYEYWESAEPLTDEYLDKYENIQKANSIPSDNEIDKKITNEIGLFEFKNIDTGNKDTRTEAQKATSTFRKNYQNCRHAIDDLQKRYDALQLRKSDPSKLPMKLELDAFISWIRDYKANNEYWREPIAKENLDEILGQYFSEWKNIDYDVVSRTQESYQLVSPLFATKESLKHASYDDLVRALTCLYSFHSRLRFFRGGLKKLIEKFKRDNSEQKVKDTFSFLFFGQGDIVDRMYHVIYDPRYRLSEFSRSGVQELTGWVCHDMVVINGRTTKVLHYLGYSVKQINEQLQ